MELDLLKEYVEGLTWSTQKVTENSDPVGFKINNL